MLSLLERIARSAIYMRSFKQGMKCTRTCAANNLPVQCLLDVDADSGQSNGH